MENNTAGWIDTYNIKTLEDFVGHDKIQKELAKRIEKGTLKQNILLSGPTGVGKSSLGSLLARTLNCTDPKLDSLKSGEEFHSPCNECVACKEIFNVESSRSFHYFDGSLLNKEKVNELRNIIQAPTFGFKHKIIYIEEIQNIASGYDKSFQTWLEIIGKDYNGRVFFIMSTMELKKLNTAVIDRFQIHLNLKKVSPNVLIDVAQKILMKENLLENIDFENFDQYTSGIPMLLKEGLQILSFSSDGSVRKFIGYLETCIYRELYSKEEILENLNIVSHEEVITLIKKLCVKDKSFFEDMFNYNDSMERFFKIAYSTLVELQIYMLTDKVKYRWQRPLFNMLKINYNNINDILVIFRKTLKNTPHFMNSLFLNNLLDYYKEKDYNSNEKIIPRRRKKG